MDVMVTRFRLVVIVFCSQILEGGTHTKQQGGQTTSRHTKTISDTHETQSRPPTHPVLTENPHPRKHPARSSSHPHARRLIGRVAKARRSIGRAALAASAWS